MKEKKPVKNELRVLCTHNINQISPQFLQIINLCKVYMDKFSLGSVLGNAFNKATSLRATVWGRAGEFPPQREGQYGKRCWDIG